MRSVCLILMLGSRLFAQMPVPVLALTDTNTVVWDPPPPSDTVSDYKAELYVPAHLVNGVPDGAPPAVVLDFGLPVNFTSPPLKPLVPPNVPLVVFLRAYAANGAFSGLSNAVGPIEVAPPQDPNACQTPTVHQITLAVKSWTLRVPVGGRGQVLFDLANAYPIVDLQVRLAGGQVIGEIPDLNGDLRDAPGVNFGVPRTAGDYAFTVFAKDSSNCTTETTVPRVFTVF